MQTKCSHTRCKTMTAVLLNMHVLWMWQCVCHRARGPPHMNKDHSDFKTHPVIHHHIPWRPEPLERVNILVFTLICTMQHFWLKYKKKKKPNDYQKGNKQHASTGAFNKQVKTRHQFRMNTTATDSRQQAPLSLRLVRPPPLKVRTRIYLTWLWNVLDTKIWWGIGEPQAGEQAAKSRN